MPRSNALHSSLVIVMTLVGLALPVAAQEQLDRKVLPIPEPKLEAIREMDIRKTTPPPRFEVKAPAGRAPNVLVILLDNLGFGAPKTLGGPVTMPTLDRLATEGVIYNNFHTAPLCSPSRMALLTGRNPHSVNFGSIAEMASESAERSELLLPDRPGQ